MIKVENIEVWGFEHAIRGMRNPMNSWDKSDSGYGIDGEDEDIYLVGQNDLDLMRRLYKAGTEHRKYLRQIFVSMDIIAPHYWWYDFDAYKVGIVRNSCSKQHKLMHKPFELDDFSHEHLVSNDKKLNELKFYAPAGVLGVVIDSLNECREAFLKTKNKEYWWQVMQLLPLSYNHKATITMNYENVVSIIKQRTGHKLDEWNMFVRELEKLPYIKDICGEQE